MAGAWSYEGDVYKRQGGQRLRADLNTSRSKNLDSGELLRFVADHALAHCSSGRDNGGFALLTLLFCKGDKELAHCDVPARPECAGEVTAFLKKQFEDNGIDKRHYAREAVVVDEVFALCCRRAEPDSHVKMCIRDSQYAQRADRRLGIAHAGLAGGGAASAVRYIRTITERK